MFPSYVSNLTITSKLTLIIGKPDYLLFCREFCIELLSCLHFQWSSGLKTRFCLLWKILSTEGLVKMADSDDVRRDMYRAMMKKGLGLMITSATTGVP